MEDGSFVEKDLWIYERRGIVLGSQVRQRWLARYPVRRPFVYIENDLLDEAAADKVINMGGNICQLTAQCS